jgi:hypothetical protein
MPTSKLDQYKRRAEDGLGAISGKMPYLFTAVVVLTISAKSNNYFHFEINSVFYIR